MKYVIMSAALMLTAPAAKAEMGGVIGTWITQDEDAKIEIADCGDGTPCGKIVWVAPNVPGGGLDQNNPDATLRTRSLIGVKIIWGYAAKNQAWKHGQIYNPQDGKTFRSSLKLASQDQLIVKGCLGPLCRSNVWTRSHPQKEVS